MASDNERTRLKLNQYKVQRKNDGFKQAIRHFFRDDLAVLGTNIGFTCECSDLSCQLPVSLTITEYEQYHKGGNHTLLKGHENLDLERIVLDKPDFVVVKKFPS